MCFVDIEEQPVYERIFLFEHGVSQCKNITPCVLYLMNIFLESGIPSPVSCSFRNNDKWLSHS